MKISALVATPIALGDPPLLNAAGVHAPYALRIVLELVTEDGTVGLSEIPGDDAVLSGLERVAPELRGVALTEQPRIRRLLADTLGRDAPGARGDRPWDRRRTVHVASAIEVACLDALGRKLGLRVVDLLGGPARDRVPYAGYLFFKYEGAGGTLGNGLDPSATGWLRQRQAAALDVEQLVAQAKAMVDGFGFRSLKVKAGILAPDLEVRATLALREAFGPEVPIRIDPNAAWTYDTALREGRRLKGAIEYYEDPVRGQREMARLRRELGIPLATNMCTTSFEELPSSVELGSEDIILADHHFWGGLRASMELARLCTTFGRSLSMHSNSHAGISFAAMTHLGAALPELTYALDTHYPWQQDEIIVGGKLPIRDGDAALPDGPGLGVELDREALARAHERYRACGLLRRDDEIEMQKREPGWRFMPVRY